jgi:hypothetical protein
VAIVPAGLPDARDLARTTRLDSTAERAAWSSPRIHLLPRCALVCAVRWPADVGSGSAIRDNRHVYVLGGVYRPLQIEAAARVCGAVEGTEQVRFRGVMVASLVQWLPLAVVIVALSGLGYILVQQDQRSLANDPQIEMATDARLALDAGASPASLVPATQFDIAESPAPYLVIYDASGQIQAASATVGGSALIPPAGVFDSARTQRFNAITWTPAPGVRSAIVVMKYAQGYVLAGRSLRYIEERESNIELLAALGGLGTLAASLIAVIAAQALGSVSRRTALG